MTVKDLKEMLKDAPDNMNIYVDIGSQLGGFVFVNACIHESGIVEFGKADKKLGEAGDADKGFIIMAHGSTISEEDIDKEDSEENNHLLN